MGEGLGWGGGGCVYDYMMGGMGDTRGLGLCYGRVFGGWVWTVGVGVGGYLALTTTSLSMMLSWEGGVGCWTA